MSKKPTTKLPPGWEWVRLGDVCTVINQRKPIELEPPVMSISKYDGFVPSLEYFSKQIFSKDVSSYKYIKHNQFAYSTIHLDEGSIARFAGDDGCLISPMYTTFEISETVDGRFLLNILKSDYMVSNYQKEAQGSVNRRKSIPFGAFSSIYIPLPPLSAQCWITDALASVDEWLKVSNENLECLYQVRREALQSIFPVGTLELADLIESIESGVSAEGANTPASVGELGVLKVSAVAQGFFKPSENKVVNGAEVSRLRKSVKAGDILISRSNTLELVGEVGISLEDHRNLFLPDKIWALRTKPDKNIDQKWLAYYLVSVKNSGMIEKLASGSSGSMKNISQKNYLKILVPQQDFRQQIDISKLLTAFDESIVFQEKSLAEADKFRQSLLHQILSGTLLPTGGWSAVIPGLAKAATP